jgi:hypothetical protein
MPSARNFLVAFAATELVDLFARQFEACRLKRGDFCAHVRDTAWNPVYAAAAMGACRELGAKTSLTTFAASTPLPAPALEAVCARADLIVYMSAFTLHFRPEINAALDVAALAHSNNATGIDRDSAVGNLGKVESIASTCPPLISKSRDLGGNSALPVGIHPSWLRLQQCPHPIA